MLANRRWLLCSSLLTAACAGDDASGPANDAPAIATPIQSRAAVVGTPFDLDVSSGFLDRKRQGLTYSVAFTPSTTTCLTLSNGRLVGTPDVPGVIKAKVIARDKAGDTVSQTFSVAVFASGLSVPRQPIQQFAYSDASRPLPPQYLQPNAPGGAAAATSNMPATNVTTDAGATLGRVLFYDTRLSANDQVACASCHLQKFGFSDTAKFSTGFAGGKTGRHASAIANARFYTRGRFFWDERAVTLEDQTLAPIQNTVEMGLTLEQLLVKLKVTSYYAPLFQAAFGTADITSDLVSKALAQYVRSIVSYGSRFDSTFVPGVPNPNFGLLTPQEQQGMTLFNGPGRCAQCHATNAQISDNIHNTGLDATVTDVGAGNGAFKSPSLRNVAVRGRFMHDGRFTTLEQVVDFYNTGIQPNPFLDGRLRAPGGAPIRLGFTTAQRDAIVAFLKTLTDGPLLSEARFANPFPN